MIPIVLHHGFLGYDEVRLGKVRAVYFKGIARAISDRGYSVIVSRVHPTGAAVRRAAQLKETILRQLDKLGRPDSRVAIFAHSMGGLDARYMISKLGMADRVSALVTIATPHHGSPYADWCVRHIGRRFEGLELMKFLGIDVQGIVDLTTGACRRFNEAIPDSPKVRYFSVSGARPWTQMPPFALPGYKIVYDAEGDNDGLVSVKSSTWGESLGVWPADHWHTINRRLVPEFKKSTLDIAPYYIKILERLEAEGLTEDTKQETLVCEAGSLHAQH